MTTETKTKKRSSGGQLILQGPDGLVQVSGVTSTYEAAILAFPKGWESADLAAFLGNKDVCRPLEAIHKVTTERSFFRSMGKSGGLAQAGNVVRRLTGDDIDAVDVYLDKNEGHSVVQALNDGAIGTIVKTVKPKSVMAVMVALANARTRPE